MEKLLNFASKMSFAVAGFFFGAHILGWGSNDIGNRSSKWNFDNISIEGLDKEAKAFEEHMRSLQTPAVTTSPSVESQKSTANDTSSTADLPAGIQEEMKRDALAAGFYRASVKTTLYPDNNGKLQPILTFGAGDCMKVHGAPSSTGLIAVSVQPWKSESATHGWVRRSDLESQPTLDCK